MSKWISDWRKDPFVLSARRDGYLSRSAYKLIEIDEKFNLIPKNNLIMDIGAAPGGWLQVLSSRSKAKILAVDLLPLQIDNNLFEFCDSFCSICHLISSIKKIVFLQKKIEEMTICNNCKDKRFDLIVSDAATNISGIKAVDLAQLKQLHLLVLSLGSQFISDNGTIIIKIFRIGYENEIFATATKLFKNVKTYKPKSSKSESSEIYLIANRLRKNS